MWTSSPHSCVVQSVWLMAADAPGFYTRSAAGWACPRSGSSEPLPWWRQWAPSPSAAWWRSRAWRAAHRRTPDRKWHERTGSERGMAPEESSHVLKKRRLQKSRDASEQTSRDDNGGVSLAGWMKGEEPDKSRGGDVMNGLKSRYQTSNKVVCRFWSGGHSRYCSQKAFLCVHVCRRISLY